MAASHLLRVRIGGGWKACRPSSLSKNGEKRALARFGALPAALVLLGAAVEKYFLVLKKGAHAKSRIGLGDFVWFGRAIFGNFWKLFWIWNFWKLFLEKCARWEIFFLDLEKCARWETFFCKAVLKITH